MEDIKKQQTKKKLKEVKSWYQDKNFALTVQRNILLITSLLLFVAVIVALIAIKTIVEKKSVEPYVIKVSSQEQIPVAISIESVKTYANAQQGVLEYFLLEYIKSRESYNFETYPYDYGVFVRRMSTPPVFQNFWNAVNDPSSGLIVTLGKGVKIDIVVKQMALEANSAIIVVRIAKRTIKNGDIRGISNYKIKMHYMFDVSNLSYKDIILNPLGIKIDFYEVVEEKTLVADSNDIKQII